MFERGPRSTGTATRPGSSSGSSTRPQPNVLRDMGRVNATPQARLVRGGYRRSVAMAALVPPAPGAQYVELSDRGRLGLGVLGGFIWFTISSAVQLFNSPASDGPVFLAGIAVTCLLGGWLGRAYRDYFSLASGSAAGLILSELFAPVGPEPRSITDTSTVAFYLWLGVVVLTPLARRGIAALRGD